MGEEGPLSGVKVATCGVRWRFWGDLGLVLLGIQDPVKLGLGFFDPGQTFVGVLVVGLVAFFELLENVLGDLSIFDPVDLAVEEGGEPAADGQGDADDPVQFLAYHVGSGQITG